MSSHTVAHERLAVLEEDQVASGCEVAVLVEHAVVGQEALPVDGLDLAAGADVTRVVEIAIEMGRADQDRRPPCLLGDPLHGFLCRSYKTGAEQEVLRRIAGHRELRKDDDVGRVGLGLREPAEDQLAVPVEVANDRVDLSQSEAHGLSLAVCDSEAKTQRGGAAESAP
jgi:hypothetical protein